MFEFIVKQSSGVCKVDKTNDRIGACRCIDSGGKQSNLLSKGNWVLPVHVPSLFCLLPILYHSHILVGVQS